MSSSVMLPSMDSLMLQESDIEAMEEEYDQVEEEPHSGVLKELSMGNVSGRLAFDEEAAPDTETRENTEYNSMSYVFGSEAADPERAVASTGHTKRVTLNTCTANVQVSRYELDFIQESAQYQVTGESRTVVVGFTGDPLSTKALQWAMGQFIADNDTLVVVQVVPLAVIMKQGVTDHYVDHEREFGNIKKANLGRVKMRLVYQVCIGNRKHHLDRAIREFGGDILVIGTSGSKKSKLGGILTEDQSLGKYYLTTGKVPVVLVNSGCIIERPVGDGGYNEDTFVAKIRGYPSLYNKDTMTEAQAMELANAGPDDGAGGAGSGRTSRFLRAGRDMARSVSRGVSGSGSGELTPVRSSSPLRTLSPFGLFKRSGK